MQARDNEILNQEEVDAVGNNEEQCGCRAHRAKKQNMQSQNTRTLQFWEWEMREGWVREHKHLESKYLGE